MITSILRWLWPPSAPPLRQIPEAILRAVALGVVVALPLSFLLTPTRTWRFFWLDPWDWFVRSIAIGITFSVSFYVACGLPISYLLRNRSAKDSRLILWTTAIVGGTLGATTALVVFAVTRGSLTPELVRLAIADGILATILTVVLSAWYTLKAEKELAEVRATNWALKAQINPHFFFNTLSTIASLIRPNPEKAEHTIGLLADMSRQAFASTAAGPVPLQREVDFAHTYLEIEKARFGDRLSWVLPTPQAVEGLALPAMTVQPLVENAVRHGIATRIEGGSVTVQVERSTTQFTLRVENPTETDEDVTTFFREGHALWNLRERLRLTYGGRASLEVESPTRDNVVISVRLPIQA